MNVKVQEFIMKMKEEEENKKKEHLIALGLIDENKTTEKREYLDNFVAGAKLDGAKTQYYIETKEYAPIEVTEEEYQEILKYAPIEEQINEKVKIGKKTTWGNAINTTANIYLVLNIIGAFILAIEFGWIPIVVALTYCILWYPIIVGISKVVKVAEKTLQE